VLLLHHSKKSDGAYRDSSAIGAAPDVVLELRRPTDGSNRRELIVAKSRWPLADLTLELGENGYQLVRRTDLGVEAQLLLFVQQHPGCSKTELRDGVKGKHEAVEAALGRLLAKGAVRNTGAGTKHQYTLGTNLAGEDDDTERLPS